ncbi:MAG: DUF5597 domain-containing protein [Calditrichaceae bacterium]|nr:DUF5597 domain-containing protein [Calditrichaceae bacterium]
MYDRLIYFLKIILSAGLIILLYCSCTTSDIGNQRLSPIKSVFLEKQEDGKQRLVVNGKPYIMLAGELGNSTASDADSMSRLWPKLKTMNINTVLAPVYWELIEKEEGVFDFSSVDILISGARKHNIKLVLLWFGSWKNSMSCYVPGWIKENYIKYPRAQDKNGKAQEILSPFCQSNLDADKKAFARLMKYIREIDKLHNTVIMIQVENEIGMLPDARDYSDSANIAFRENVPAELMDYLKNNSLHPPLVKNEEGSWEEVFGKSLATDELFMAWHYARYANAVARSGKNEYDLPMFVNAALNRPGRKPGEYPSAGPLPHLADIWKAGAPAIDFLAPDIYFINFADWCAKYDLPNNPLFIPETYPNHLNLLYAIGKHNAIGFSPFAIESLEGKPKELLSKSYALISNIQHLITGYQDRKSMTAVKLSDTFRKDTVDFEGYRFRFAHDFSLGWSKEIKEYEQWPETGALVIQLSADEFFVCGTGIVITFENTSENPDLTAGILLDENGYFDQQGNWKVKMTLNGDQTHQGRHLSIPFNAFQINRLKLYRYK